MSKLLVVIPCLYGKDHTKEAIESVVNQKDVDLVIISNGAELEVKVMLMDYMGRQNVLIINNKTNLYVTAAWQQGIIFFMAKEEYSHLIIMNSDLIMQGDWAEVLRNRWAVNPNEICIPNGHPTKDFESVTTEIQEATEVSEGTPGVFITLSRKQVGIVQPLPPEIKVWFNDNWIFEILRRIGFKTVIPKNLISHHYHNGSQTVSRVPNISEIIELDKVAWNDIVSPRKEALIAEYLEKSKSVN